MTSPRSASSIEASSSASWAATADNVPEGMAISGQGRPESRPEAEPLIAEILARLEAVPDQCRRERRTELPARVRLISVFTQCRPKVRLFGYSLSTF